MEISNPVIPTTVTGQSQNSIGQSSRLPVKADKFPVNPNNSKILDANQGSDPKSKRSRVDDDKQSQKNSALNVAEEKKPDQQNTDAALVVGQENPLLLARQKAGQLAPYTANNTELAVQNSGGEIIQGASAEETEQLPRSIQTYLDTSRIDPDDESVSKNIDFFI